MIQHIFTVVRIGTIEAKDMGVSTTPYCMFKRENKSYVAYIRRNV